MPLLRQRAARGFVRSRHRQRNTLLSQKLPASSFSSLPQDAAISPAELLLLDVIEAVGAIRDGLHLQDCLYLAQEYGLIPLHYVFGYDFPALTGGVPSRPYSHLLDTHYHELLRRRLVEPHYHSSALQVVWSNKENRFPRASREAFETLGILTSGETALLVRTTVWLARHGKHIRTPMVTADLPDALAITADRMRREARAEPLVHAPTLSNKHETLSQGSYQHICSVCTTLTERSPLHTSLVG